MWTLVYIMGLNTSPLSLLQNCHNTLSFYTDSTLTCLLFVGINVTEELNLMSWVLKLKH